jgi:hypothetical protein
VESVCRRPVLHGIDPPSPCAPRNRPTVTLCSTKSAHRHPVLHRIIHRHHEFHRVGGRTLAAVMKPNQWWTLAVTVEPYRQ